MSAIAQVEPMTTARSLRGPFDYRLPEELRAVVQVGSMLVVPFGRRQVLGVVVGLAERSHIAAERLLAPLRALEHGVPADLVALSDWLAREYCSTRARALGLVLAPEAARRLGGRRRAERAPARAAAMGPSAVDEPELTADQQAALAPIVEAVDEGVHSRRLLHGVTGSGKTEIYLRAAARALRGRRGVIVLVPEIGLTPQIVGRFGERFGDTVAVLHSQLRPAERYAEWKRLRTGQARVCVGPRSAIFAPVQDLGLIIVDEEHDAAYKHEGDPRYDAREVAVERARSCGALLLLGSATPRPETLSHVARSRLPRRVDGRPLPEVQVLDMREQPHGLHPASADALARVRAEREKAIILLNRRGWSNFLSCRSCGRVWSCPQCDVALVMHRAGGYVACHHCGHRSPVPGRCDTCSSTSVARHGAGTERLQHELESVLGGDRFPVLRLDADVAAAGRSGSSAAPAARSAAGAGGYDQAAGALLARFDAADCGVLIGTQMIAKGHDFSDVALGLVLDADATLRFPDFRAEERTFALISQLAGRVGRGGAGRVLVQTLAPQARSIACAAGYDSDGFLAAELERRRALSYPPFSHLIRIVCSAVELARATAAAVDLRAALTGSQLPADTGVLGPAALFRLRGRERQVLLIKAPARRPAVDAVGGAVQAVAARREHAGVNFSVDVDPQ